MKSRIIVLVGMCAFVTFMISLDVFEANCEKSHKPVPDNITYKKTITPVQVLPASFLANNKTNYNFLTTLNRYEGDTIVLVPKTDYPWYMELRLLSREDWHDYIGRKVIVNTSSWSGGYEGGWTYSIESLQE